MQPIYDKDDKRILSQVSFNEDDEKKILRQFGLRIKKLRNEKELKQKELAVMTKLHYTYISSLERGERNVSLINIKKICIALDCSPEYLMREYKF